MNFLRGHIIDAEFVRKSGRLERERMDGEKVAFETPANQLYELKLLLIC